MPQAIAPLMFFCGCLSLGIGIASKETVTKVICLAIGFVIAGSVVMSQIVSVLHPE